MKSARISMDLDEYNTEISTAKIKGASEGQANIIEIFRSFELGKQDQIKLPSDMNTSLKKQVVEFIELLDAHFNPGEEG